MRQSTGPFEFLVYKVASLMLRVSSVHRAVASVPKPAEDKIVGYHYFHTFEIPPPKSCVVRSPKEYKAAYQEDLFYRYLKDFENKCMRYLKIENINCTSVEIGMTMIRASVEKQVRRNQSIVIKNI